MILTLFSIENMWLLHPKFGEIIMDVAWDSGLSMGMTDLLCSLKSIKAFFEVFKEENFDIASDRNTMIITIGGMGHMTEEFWYLRMKKKIRLEELWEGRV